MSREHIRVRIQQWMRGTGVVVALAGFAPIGVPAQWYTMVQPYHYDASHRFEGGWNRGVDVRTRSPRVRSISGGRVRFVGRVAGRWVVTVQSHDRRWGRVVVTYTGLHSVGRVRIGQRMHLGQTLGTTGTQTVHIGMYDPTQRWRYLPLALRASAVHEHVTDRGRGQRDSGESLAASVGTTLEQLVAGHIPRRAMHTRVADGEPWARTRGPVPDRTAAGGAAATAVVNEGAVHGGMLHPTPVANTSWKIGPFNSVFAHEVAETRTPSRQATAFGDPRMRSSTQRPRPHRTIDTEYHTAQQLSTHAVAHHMGNAHPVAHALRILAELSAQPALSSRTPSATAPDRRQLHRINRGRRNSLALARTRTREYVHQNWLWSLTVLGTIVGVWWLFLRGRKRRKGSRELSTAAGTHRAVVELLEIATLSTEHTLIDGLGEDDPLALHIDLERIAFGYGQSLTNLNWNDDASELVNLTHNTGVFHGNCPLRD